MIKLVALIKRPDGVSKEDFNRWWLEKHVPLAKKFPGLRRYVVNLAIEQPGEEPPFDGFSELWFDDEKALRAAFNSPDGKAAKEDADASVKRIVRLVIDERQILP